jgi:hypothetical protein
MRITFPEDQFYFLENCEMEHADQWITGSKSNVPGDLTSQTTFKPKRSKGHDYSSLGKAAWICLLASLFLGFGILCRIKLPDFYTY